MKLYQYNSLLNIAGALIREGHPIEAKEFLSSNGVNVSEKVMRDSFSKNAKLFERKCCMKGLI